MESFLKVGHSPENLCFLIPVDSQGQDDVVINLRDGIPVAEPFQAELVCFKDLPIDRRKFYLQPGEERGTKIETHGGVVIDEIKDLAFPVKGPGIGIGPVALEGNPLIPVVKGMGAFLRLNDFKPGVLPGRLIEMTVDGDIGVFFLWRIGHDLNLDFLFYRTSLAISKQFLIPEKNRKY
jgi:hypothetical protein